MRANPTSSVAYQALAFATPKTGSGGTGALIVASVPASEIRTVCQEKLPQPGAILDLYPCPGIHKEHKTENDTFLYLKPEWTLWVYKVPESS